MDVGMKRREGRNMKLSANPELGAAPSLVVVPTMPGSVWRGSERRTLHVFEFQHFDWLQSKE